MKKFSSRIGILLFILCFCATSAGAVSTLIPGGQVVVLQLQDGTVTVTDFDENLGKAARSAGLTAGDRIVQIDDTRISCAEDVRKALSCCDGQIDISVKRGDTVKKLTMQPPLTDDGPRLGIYLRQGTTGLGTVTYYDPDSHSFAALGHGVNNPDGNLLRLQSGTVHSAQVFSVNKGKVGTPGQLLGALSDPTALGTLYKNTDQGVFGTAKTDFSGEALPIAKPSEVSTGAAAIRSTVNDYGMQEYSVEILKIYPNTGNHTRNLLLKITDPRLLETTGGIVQGMSGSPIIQDGKLIGAVTHVLVNDPTTGYGIFIENMLDAAA